MNAITIEDLSFSYPKTRTSEPRLVLDHLNLSVREGLIFGLLGPNGSGKSTLFKICSTLMTPQLGAVSVVGIDVKKFPHQVRQKIGVVFQNPSLDKKLSLRENIWHQGRLYGLSAHDIHHRTQDLAQQLSVTERLDDMTEVLSGGFQRRGEIAKGLLHYPPLLLMDEPSTGLDPGARRELWEVLKTLQKSGMTILMTTHLMEDADRCDELAILHHGRCVASGTPDQLKQLIGGDVISIETVVPTELAEKIRQRFSVNTQTLDHTVRLELKNGHQMIPQLVESFPGLIHSITLGKPTLEDVFIHQTGESI